MYSTNIKCMPPYTWCALRVGWLEKCSKEVGVRCCRSTGIVTSCVNKAKVAEFLQTRFRIDLKSAVKFKRSNQVAEKSLHISLPVLYPRNPPHPPFYSNGKLATRRHELLSRILVVSHSGLPQCHLIL